MSATARLPNHLRPRREKVFGYARGIPLDGNAKARLCRDTVYEAIKVLEDANVLTWVNRIWREQVRERDLFGQWTTRWRIVRTSNAYKGSPIALHTTIGMTHSRSHCGMGHLRGGSGPLQDAIEAGQGPAAVWRASGGRYRGG
jgi:hypothetical protein